MNVWQIVVAVAAAVWFFGLGFMRGVSTERRRNQPIPMKRARGARAVKRDSRAERRRRSRLGLTEE